MYIKTKETKYEQTMRVLQQHHKIQQTINRSPFYVPLLMILFISFYSKDFFKITSSKNHVMGSLKVNSLIPGKKNLSFYNRKSNTIDATKKTD